MDIEHVLWRRCKVRGTWEWAPELSDLRCIMSHMAWPFLCVCLQVDIYRYFKKTVSYWFFWRLGIWAGCSSGFCICEVIGSQVSTCLFFYLFVWVLQPPPIQIGNKCKVFLVFLLNHSNGPTSIFPEKLLNCFDSCNFTVTETQCAVNNLSGLGLKRWAQNCQTPGESRCCRIRHYENNMFLVDIQVWTSKWR